MALTLSTTARSSMADALLADIDAGTGAILRLFTSGDSPLVDIALNDPSFTESNGVLTVSTTPSDPSGTATADGTAAKASILTQDGGTVIVSEMTVGLTSSGSDVELSNTVISTSGEVSITGGTITVPAS